MESLVQRLGLFLAIEPSSSPDLADGVSFDSELSGDTWSVS